MTNALPLSAFTMTISRLELTLLRAKSSSLGILDLGSLADFKIQEKSCRISSTSWDGRWVVIDSIEHKISSIGR